MMVALASVTFHAQSKSYISCGVDWNAHTNLPVVTSTAKIDALQRFGPGLVVAL